MASARCTDETLDNSNYASPMPVIGLYVAGATLVCFLFIFFDIQAGLRNKKQWLPCRFFSLNSVTLTLFSIAAKIPVDLTTTMPSPQDQLSKLTGTTLICTCMGFLIPSLGTNGDSECSTNATAMTILVVTILVNICIQMSTGVIILFRVEHIIILCCMMVLLVVLLCSTFDITSQKEVSIGQNKDLFTKGKGSLMRRLKLCYLYAYGSNPQLELCKDIDYVVVGIFCMISSVVVVQATIRSVVLKELKLCSDLSDYKWSIWIIIMTQIVTILMACLGTSFRCLRLFHHMNPDTIGITWPTKDVEDIILDNPQLDLSAKDALTITLMYGMSFVIVLFGVFISLPLWLLCKWIESCTQSKILSSICRSKDGDSEDITEFEDLIDHEDGETGLEEWTLKKGVKDMKKWVERIKSESPNYLIELFAKTPPSQEFLNNQLKEYLANKDKIYEISSLSIVLLVRIATVSIPSTLSGCLHDSLKEIFEVIHFIERKMSSTSFKNRKKSKLAKATWEGQDFATLLPKITNEAIFQADEGSLDRAIQIIGGLKQALPSDFVWDELGIIIDFLLRQSYGSIEELYGFMEQFFVDMLNEFLIQLPNAIFKEIIESHPEDYEERIKFSLKALCLVESLEAVLQWSYPVGTNITNLIADRDVGTSEMSINDATNKVASCSLKGSDKDEIIQIE